MNYSNIYIVNRKAIVINFTITFLLFCLMFLSFEVFVEVEILSKWYAFIGGAVVLGITSLLVVESPKITIDSITILTFTIVGYLLITSLSSPLTTSNIHILSIIAFIVIYLSFKLIPYEYFRYIDVAILCVCIIQACYGLMQYMGIFNTYKVFNMIGSFDNPAGFAACLSTGFSFGIYAVFKGGWRHYLGIIALLLITLSIILSGSRTGIIAIVAVSLVYFANKYRVFRNKYRRCFILAIAAIGIAGVGLFFLKKDSALGRVLIWKNSMEMITDKPVFGRGDGSFMGNYMSYQASYFSNNHDSPYSMLADNVTHPFNEYLLLAIEYGIIGLLLLLATIIVIIKSFKQMTLYHLCLLSMCIFACFSYPLRYPFVVVLIAYCLANIKLKAIFTSRVKFAGKTIGIVSAVAMLLFLIIDIRFEKQWGELVQRVRFGNSEQLIDSYEKLHSRWNGDPMFLYNYGAILNRAEKYEQSNNVLIKCTEFFNDYDVQMILADNYMKLEQWAQAENHYIVAHNMIPNKFIPLYRLMLLYEYTKEEDKLLEIANVIIHKTVKVPSVTVSQIQNKAQNIIEAQ